MLLGRAGLPAGADDVAVPHVGSKYWLAKLLACLL